MRAKANTFALWWSFRRQSIFYHQQKKRLVSPQKRVNERPRKQVYYSHKKCQRRQNGDARNEIKETILVINNKDSWWHVGTANFHCRARWRKLLGKKDIKLTHLALATLLNFSKKSTQEPDRPHEDSFLIINSHVHIMLVKHERKTETWNYTIIKEKELFAQEN